jgi:hypothetical protein
MARRRAFGRLDRPGAELYIQSGEQTIFRVEKSAESAPGDALFRIFDERSHHSYLSAASRR